MAIHIAKNIISKAANLSSSPGFRRYFANTSWLFAEKVLRMFVGLFVGVWVARYLGPEKFGLLSYAQSFVGLFSAFATLGLDGIVVRELVKHPEKEGELLGTAFVLKLIGAFLTLTVLAIAVNFTSNDLYTNILIFIIASSTIFQAFNVIDMYFQAKVLGKFIAYANSLSLFLGSIVKVCLIFINAPLVAFAFVVVFESFVLAMGYVYFYWRRNGLKSVKLFTFRLQTAKSLLKDSWPLVLSGLVIMIYMRIDQVMIKEMLGAEAVGQYAAAVRISETLFFLFPVIINSLAPAVFRLYREDFDKAKQEKYMQLYYSVIFYSCLLYSILLYVFSPSIVLLSFGKDYEDSIPIFKIHVFSNIFAFIGGMTHQWYLAKGLQNLIFLRGLVGAIINVVLNIILIPLYGTKGAAISTVISYAYVSIFSMLHHKSTRENFRLFFSSLYYPIKLTQHPSEVTKDIEADEYTSRKMFYLPSIYERVLNKVRRLFA